VAAWLDNDPTTRNGSISAWTFGRTHDQTLRLLKRIRQHLLHAPARHTRVTPPRFQKKLGIVWLHPPAIQTCLDLVTQVFSCLYLSTIWPCDGFPGRHVTRSKQVCMVPIFFTLPCFSRPSAPTALLPSMHGASIAAADGCGR
jgi:hypothetical protein